MCLSWMHSVLCCSCWSETDMIGNASLDTALLFPSIPPSDALKKQGQITGTDIMHMQIY